MKRLVIDLAILAVLATAAFTLALAFRWTSTERTARGSARIQLFAGAGNIWSAGFSKILLSDSVRCIRVRAAANASEIVSQVPTCVM